MTSAASPPDAQIAYPQASLHHGHAFLQAEQPDPSLDHLPAALEHHLPGGLKPHLPLLIREAEHCAAAGDHREAIQRWQDILAQLAEAPPEPMSHQLSSGMRPDLLENRGDQGISLACATGSAIGVGPRALSRSPAALP